MKVVIVYSGTFPNVGYASGEHIMSYSKGLVKKGHEVWIYAFHPDESVKESTETKGLFEGVYYQYPVNAISWAKRKNSVFRRFGIKVKSIVGAINFLRKSEADVVIHVAHPEEEYLLWKLISKFCKFKFIIERTELPDIFKDQHKYGSGLKKRLYKRIVELSFSFPDAWIVETKTLQEYYQRYAKAAAKFYILPMTVEIERFMNINKKDDQEEYIAYCGNMREDDGVSILIKAFKIIADKYPNLYLKLAGYSNDTPKQKELACQIGLQDRVVFLGKINRDSIPSFLGNAILLALASPTSLRSCATMPCKVGEYLCTGVPAVVTGLGEINNYLIDRESAYLAQPDSPELFAQKLDEALSDSLETRSSIVERGYQVVLKFFSANSQAQKLIEIFSSIKQNKY